MMINKRLIGLCKNSKKYIGLTIAANLVSLLCNIVTIIIIGQFINELYLGKGIYVAKSRISIMITLAVMILMIAIRFVCNMMYVKFSGTASADARITLRNLLYEKLLKLGPSYTSVESTSSVVQLAVDGIEQLEVYFGRYLPQFFYSMLAPIMLFIFMSFISVKAALVFILCVPLIPISIIAIMKIAKRILKDYWKSYADLGGSFLENLQGLTTLKVFNIDAERHEKMNEEAEGFRRITMKVLSMQLNSITIMDLVAFGGSAAGIITALYQFKNGEIMIGSLLVIILLSSEFFIPLRLLGSYFHIAMNGMAASDRMFKLLDAPERKAGKTEGVSHDMKSVEVSLKNVGFSYDGERKVLRNISMDIRKGGVTAIVGESGSGKSTIASLIMNSYDVSEGEILINDMNISTMSSEDIYSCISIVSTGSHIFNGSIRDNLFMAKKDASAEEIKNALKAARLDKFVDSLNDGMLTDVGQGGNMLSGGQKQRLALARAILSDREMIIFDEATSNIDVESEEAIWESIYELSEKKTVLVISHRLANVKDAAKIYVMKNGEMAEQGTHEELMDCGGCYFDMVEKQNELERVREAV